MLESAFSGIVKVFSTWNHFFNSQPFWPTTGRLCCVTPLHCPLVDVEELVYLWPNQNSVLSVPLGKFQLVYIISYDIVILLPTL